MHKPVGRNLIRLLSLAVLTSAAILHISCANGGLGFRKEDPLLFSGTIETREIRVGSKLGGRVTEALVLEGQETQAGQTIVRFDIAGVEAQRLQAEAKVAQQQARLERLERGARPEEKA
jgi:HlyD family secretion protein